MTKITLNTVGNLIDTTTAQTTINSNFSTIQTAMDNTLSRDGTAPNTIQADVDWNSNRLLNLPTPTTAFEPLRLFDAATLSGGGTVSIVPTAGTNILVTGTPPASTISTVASPVFTGVQVSGLSASSAVQTDGSKNLTSISNTGTAGNNVLSISPVLTTPNIGVATATTVNKVTITQPATTATLTIPDTVVLTGPAASGTVMTLGNTETVTGVKTFGSAGAVGRFKIAGTTSGTTVVDATAVASGTLTLPAATDTLIGKATTDTLTNKTYDTAGAGNSFSINSLAATANTGTGSVVRASTPTLVTPVLGAATATTINGSTVSPGHYSGEPSTGNAAAGEIGEYLESVIVQGSALALTTSVAKTITSISLTAGDWDVDGVIQFSTGATTSVSLILSSLSLTTNTNDPLLGRQNTMQFPAWVPGTSTLAFSSVMPPLRFSVSSTTSVFLVALSTFTVSTMSGYGIIRARRVR